MALATRSYRCNGSGIEKKSAVVNCVSATGKAKPLDKLIEFYSELYRLKRAIACMLRLKEILQHLSNKRREIQATISQTENNQNKKNILVEHVEMLN